MGKIGLVEWSEQESRGGNSEGRNKKRKVNSRAKK